jgi:hypothetical protein
MGRATELVSGLKKLTRREPRSGQDVVAAQLPAFGQRLAALAQSLDKAQRRIEILTWVIAALTAVLVIDAVLRFIPHR